MGLVTTKAYSPEWATYPDQYNIIFFQHQVIIFFHWIYLVDHHIGLTILYFLFLWNIMHKLDDLPLHLWEQYQTHLKTSLRISLKSPIFTSILINLGTTATSSSLKLYPILISESLQVFAQSPLIISESTSRRIFPATHISLVFYITGDASQRTGWI